MAVVKISELPAMQTIAGSDILPIVDTSETETKKVTKQMLLTDIDASEVKIGDLTEATQINDADYLIINQSGTNKKISKANARFASGDEISIGTTQPSEEEKLWINPNEVPYGTGFLLDTIYPVGSIYINTTGVNPSSFLGGTWESFGAGRVLVGQNTSDSDFDTLLETGGSKALCKHDHAKTDSYGVTGWGLQQNSGGYSDYIMMAGATTANTKNLRTDYTGSNTADVSKGNLQPYIVVSMWKRTA